MPTEHKRGRLGKDEMLFIKENATRLSPRAIAEELNRSPETISAYIVQELGIIPAGLENSPIIKEIREDLRSTMEWKRMQDEFNLEELEYFEYRYAKLMTQFQSNITPSEETQLHTMIKYEILMSRNLRDQQKSSSAIKRIEKGLKATYDKYRDVSEMNDNEKLWTSNQENILASLRASEKSNTNEYKVLQTQHSSIMKELKATRDQRLTKVENIKQSFLGLIRAMAEEETQRRAGRHMELVKLATEKEKSRLSEYYEYADKTVDQPLLTSETVLED